MYLCTKHPLCIGLFMCLSVQVLASLDVDTQQTLNYVSLACFRTVSGFFLLCIYIKQPPVCVSVFVFVCVSVSGQNVYTQQIAKTLLYLCFLFQVCLCVPSSRCLHTTDGQAMCL